MGHGVFYALQLLALGLWWVLLKLKTGKHLHDLCNSSVVTRPSWLPAAWLLQLVSCKRSVFLFLPAALALACLAADHVAARVVAALAVSAYHLVETSFTSRHGEYPVLYMAWAMVLPERCARAAAEAAPRPPSSAT